jgi:hypothetical protein
MEDLVPCIIALDFSTNVSSSYLSHVVVVVLHVLI